MDDPSPEGVAQPGSGRHFDIAPAPQQPGGAIVRVAAAKYFKDQGRYGAAAVALLGPPYGLGSTNFGLQVAQKIHAKMNMDAGLFPGSHTSGSWRDTGVGPYKGGTAPEYTSRTASRSRAFQ